MEGEIKFFNEEKGFGFVTDSEGKEYFVHISGIENNQVLKEGQKVTFEIEQGDRGPKAVDVKVTSEDSAEAEDEE